MPANNAMKLTADCKDFACSRRLLAPHCGLAAAYRGRYAAL